MAGGWLGLFSPHSPTHPPHPAYLRRTLCLQTLLCFRRVPNMSNRPKFDLAMNILTWGVSLNVAASIITILLIFFMRRNGTLKVNLYVKCVLLMTLYQGIYDYALLPVDGRCGAPSGKHFCTAFYTFCFVVPGYGAALWSIMLLIAALFTVEMGRKPTYREEIGAFVFVHVLMFSYFWPITRAGYYASTDMQAFVDQIIIYDISRLVLIGISFLVMFRFYFVFLKMSVPNERKRSPLYHLILKLIFYPLVQCMCRLAPTPYDMGYHSTMADFPENAGALQTFLVYLEVIFLPTAGIGAFIVFLLMQRGTYAELKRMLCFDFSIVPVDATIANQDDKEKNKRVRRSTCKESVGTGLSRMEEDDDVDCKNSEDHGNDHPDAAHLWDTRFSAFLPNGNPIIAQQGMGLPAATAVDYDYDYSSRISSLSQMNEDELVFEFMREFPSKSSHRTRNSDTSGTRSSSFVSASASASASVSTPASTSTIGVVELRQSSGAGF